MQKPASSFGFSSSPAHNGVNLSSTFTHQAGTPNHNVTSSLVGSGNLHNGNTPKLSVSNYGAKVEYNKWVKNLKNMNRKSLF